MRISKETDKEDCLIIDFTVSSKSGLKRFPELYALVNDLGSSKARATKPRAKLIKAAPTQQSGELFPPEKACQDAIENGTYKDLSKAFATVEHPAIPAGPAVQTGIESITNATAPPSPTCKLMGTVDNVQS